MKQQWIWPRRPGKSTFFKMVKNMTRDDETLTMSIYQSGKMTIALIEIQERIRRLEQENRDLRDAFKNLKGNKSE